MENLSLVIFLLVSWVLWNRVGSRCLLLYFSNGMFGSIVLYLNCVCEKCILLVMLVLVYWLIE